PDSASEQVKLTTTSVLFQPSAFAAGVREPAIVGGVLSSLTTTDPLSVLPTRSTAVAVFVVPLASRLSLVTVSVVGVGPPATPAPPSAAVHVMVTSVLNHCAALGCADRLPVTFGPAASMV